MARVPAEEIERLKREVSVTALAEARGVKLAPHGADLIGLCPFHDDHEPSLVVTPSKNLWHCFGACQCGGSPIDWVMKAEGKSFRHCVELLRNGYPSSFAAASSAPSGAPPKRSAVPKLPVPVVADAEDAELLRQVASFYHDSFKESPEALHYLQSRGLSASEMVERFQLGFANRTLGYRLPSKDSSAGQEVRARLHKLGILRKSGHEHLNGCVVIPIFDEQGAVAGMYGRRIIRNVPGGSPVHLYLPGPHRGVWNLDALRASREVILCEALIDALTFWCAGFRNVTSAYGVSGFTPDHLEAMKRYQTERVLIAYDRDDAGDKAAAELASRLAGEGIECWRILFPRGMDANEYARKVTPAARSLDVVIRSAQPMGAPGARRLVVGGSLLVDEPAEAPGSPPTAAREPAEPPSSSFAVGSPSPASQSPDSPASTPALAELAPALAAEPRPPAPPVRHSAESAFPELPASPERSASPLPAAPRPDIAADVRDNEIIIPLGERRWRIRGLGKNMSYELLKVNVLVSCGEAFHVDTFDLYSAKARTAFLGMAASELGIEEDILRKDLGKVLLKLEELQEEQIRKALEPKDETVPLSDEEKAEALALLRDPKLLERIGADFEACGLVGEEVNRLVGYLTAVSRKLERPLAIMVQSSSAAGKSALMEAVLALMPEEERVQYSAMTGQSLFYMDGTSLKNKILAIAEEEGAERASYALKLLQSEGKLSIASTGKDPASGRLVTHEYHVEGPVAILLTTTAIDLDEELRNRCVVLTVDEGREQTRAIHRRQRRKRTWEGLIESRSRSKILTLHQNAQRLLRPLGVLNPFADALTFLDTMSRTRRDHEKYLTLIDAVALLHQYQRPLRGRAIDGQSLQCVEVTLEDVALANRLAGEVLGHTLHELPPQTRRLLALIEELVKKACKRLEIEKEDYRFSRRDVREATGWGNTQLRVHLARLVEMEYLYVHRGSKGQNFVYELVYDGQGKDGSPFFLGLIDIEKLKHEDAPRYEANLAGVAVNLAGSKRGQSGPKAGGWRDAPNAAPAPKTPDFEPKPPPNAHLDDPETASPYVDGRRNRAALAAAAAPAPLALTDLGPRVPGPSLSA